MTSTVTERNTMSENAITRRGFLAGGTGVAAVAVAGGLGLTGCSEPYTVSDHKDEEPTYRQGSGVCAACPRLCAYTAYIRNNNRVTKLIASAGHPSTMGKLCARGYAFSRSAYAPDRLTEPLRAKSDGTFEQIDWATAFNEIGAKLAGVDADGVLVVHGSEPTQAFYATRLANALGSGASYGIETDYEPSRLGGYAQVLGEGITGWDVDVRNCRALLVLGTPARGFSPAQLKRLTAAKEAGCQIVYAGPVRDGVGSHADWWLPVVPGHELALLLAIANRLIDGKAYDEGFVRDHAEGFDDFKKAMEPYTPAWAEATCGIPATDIAHLAQVLADARPACAIASQGGFGQGMAASGETARMVAAVNTLLGCWNQKGGAQLWRAAKPADLGDLAVDAPQTKAPDAAPLAPAGLGGVTALLTDDKARDVLVFGCDPAIDGRGLGKMRAAFKKAGLVVAVDWRMSETASMADYVLPCCAQLEYDGMPAFTDGTAPAVSISSKMIDPVAPDAKPIDEICAGIAAAAGVTGAFDHTLADFATAELDGWDTSLDNLRSVATVSAANTSDGGFGTLPAFATPSGKIQLTSSACADAGLSAAPQWVGTGDVVNGGSFAGYVAALPYQTCGADAATPGLARIGDTYLAGRVVISAATASELGMSDGDEVTISSATESQRVVLGVSDHVMPGVAVIPAGFDTVTAQNGGETRVVAARLVGDDIETGYGSPVNRVVKVSIQKAGA